MYQDYKNHGFVILNVLIDNGVNQAMCKSWADRWGLTFPVLSDSQRMVWNLYDDEGYIPLNLVIDQNMVIQYKSIGYRHFNLNNKIRELLGLPYDY